MKVTQYFTTERAEFLQVPVFPSVKLDGIHTVCRTDRILRRDFLGFGVAVTGSSCFHLSQMPAEQRKTLLQSLYGRKDGLGLSVGRISIASSDYSPELYSYDDVDGDRSLTHFSVERDCAYIIPMLQEIQAVNPNLYWFASPWSPPAWMKTGASLGGGYMRREFIDCYADYIVAFLKAYEKHGIKISALTPQNEPQTEQNRTMPACIWHPDIEAEFVLTLRKKLQENGLDTKIWLFDHNFADWSRVQWMLDTHQGLSDACDGIAFHYYAGDIEDTLPLQQAYPNLPMHFTEGGPRLYDHYADDWCKWGMMMAKVLGCGYQSFTGWNLMLDSFGAPNIGPFSCGGLITRNTQTNELSYSGQYKALMHFSKFIKKNAIIYHVEQEREKSKMYHFPKQNERPIQSSCVQNEDGTVCYFLVNPNATKAQVQFFEHHQWYYAEVLPDTVCTVVFEKESSDLDSPARPC